MTKTESLKMRFELAKLRNAATKYGFTRDVVGAAEWSVTAYGLTAIEALEQVVQEQQQRRIADHKRLRSAGLI